MSAVNLGQKMLGAVKTAGEVLAKILLTGWRCHCQTAESIGHSGQTMTECRLPVNFTACAANLLFILGADRAICRVFPEWEGEGIEDEKK